MAADGLTELSLEEKNNTQLPEEILEAILSLHQLPSAPMIGFAWYESINVAREPLIQNDSPMDEYLDDILSTGTCTHQHDHYNDRLRTLSATSKVNRKFHESVLPRLYAVFKGQTVVKPQLSLRSIKPNPDLAALVKQLVTDP